MRFSLILATVDRTEEVKRFLASLDAQTHRDFELIVVDQNADAGLASILEPYEDSFPILHLHRPLERGASKARNLGLQNVKGAVVSCPDDDCWYPPQLLEQAACFLNEHPEADGISGRLMSGPEQLAKNVSISASMGTLIRSPVKVMDIPGMVGLFLRTRVVDMVGKFDETLGPGAGTPWGSGEDTDYHLRIFKAGFSLCSSPELVVFHPTVDSYYAEGRDLDRSYRYGAGRARVWRRHGLPPWYFPYQVARSLAGALLSLARGQRPKAYWHWGAFRGKLRGWFSGKDR